MSDRDFHVILLLFGGATGWIYKYAYIIHVWEFQSFNFKFLDIFFLIQYL